MFDVLNRDPHPRVALSEEVADFLAGELADEAFHDFKGETECKDEPGVEGLRLLKRGLDRTWEQVELLEKKREVELTGVLMSFVGQVLGRCESRELEGWCWDEEEYAEKRRLARATWAALLEALSKIDFDERERGGTIAKIPANCRALFNKEAKATVDYIPARPDYAAHQKDADALLELVEAEPEGDLNVPVTGALSLTLGGCILEAGIAVSGCAEKWSGEEARERIRSGMETLTYWCDLAKAVERATKVVLS